MGKSRKAGIGIGCCFVFFASVLYCSYQIVKENTVGYSEVLSFYRILVILLLLALTGFGIWFFVIKRKPGIETAATVLLVFFSLIYALVLIPFSSPDERAHFMTTYVISDVLLGEEPYDENGAVMIREEDLLYFEGTDTERLSENVSKEDFAYYYDHLFERTDKKTMVSSDYKNEDAQVYTSTLLAHFPQALGLTLARLLSCSLPMALLISRLFGLLFFAPVFYFSLKLLPRGKMVMAAVGLFPMTISLVASLSHDVVILSLGFLFISYVFSLREQEGIITKKQTAFMLLLLFLFTPWRISNAIMALLCFVIPPSRFKDRKTYILSAVLVVLVVAAGVLAANFTSFVWIFTGTKTEIAYTEENSYTLSYLITHPLWSARMAAMTIWMQADWYYQTMIGQYPGQLDVELGIYNFTVAGFFITACLSAVPAEGETSLYTTKRDVVVVVLLLVLMTIFTELSMAIGVTPTTSNYIVGVQGRYYLLFIPLAFLLIGKTGLRLKKPISYPLLYAMVLLHITSIARLVERIAFR